MSTATPSSPSAPPASTSSIGERYHSLDFLRGALMLLGLVFHAALTYDDQPLAGVVKPYPTSSVLGFITTNIHLFRMPLFFVLAGFFASLLIVRRGAPRFALNRGIRIGVPLLAAWAALLPLVTAGVIFSIAALFFSRTAAWNVAENYLDNSDLYFRDQLGYLWFLFYLLVFYVAFIPIAYLARRIPAATAQRLLDVQRQLLGPARVLMLAIPTFALMYVVPFGTLATPDQSFVPEVDFTIYYGAFFAIGALLYCTRDVIRDFGPQAWLYLALAIVLLVVFNHSADQWNENDSQTWRAIGVVCGGIAIWSLFFSLTSLLMRYINRPIAAVRYTSDASYWMYLVHVPFLVWLPGLIARETWSPELKFLAVLLPTTLFCVVTYDLLVRWTYLGTLLQGRRYRSATSALLHKLRAKAPEPAATS